MDYRDFENIKELDRETLREVIGFKQKAAKKASRQVGWYFEKYFERVGNIKGVTTKVQNWFETESYNPSEEVRINFLKDGEFFCYCDVGCVNNSEGYDIYVDFSSVPFEQNRKYKKQERKRFSGQIIDDTYISTKGEISFRALAAELSTPAINYIEDRVKKLTKCF